MSGHHKLFAAAILLAAQPMLLPIAAPAAAAAQCETVSAAFSYKLPNASGQTITGVIVSYPPACKSVAHHHAGSVTAYVLSGTIRSQNSATGPERDYKAGESFFEPPGSHHTTSENASASESATLLAIFVAPDASALTAEDEH